MSQRDLIQAVLRLLADLGVREVCVAAGARNAPVLAALLDSRGVRVWNFFEERSAGFFAFGRVRATGRPVAVLTTSGTAAAELLPAVIEAHYQALPLIAFTADRPKSHRGTGAPQAIEQADLFGVYPRTAWDLDHASALPAASEARLDGPLHLNLCLDEPLATDVPGIDFEDFKAPAASPPAGMPLDLAALAAARRPVVLAAGMTPAEAAQACPFLLALRAPVLAEAASNLWSLPQLGALLSAPHDSLLQTLAPDHILRLGAVPSGRFWRDLESRPEVIVTNVSAAPFSGLARREAVSLHPWSALAQTTPAPCLSPLPPRPPDADFSAHPRCEPAFFPALRRCLGPGSLLFLGNSLPIREFNDAIAPLPAGVTIHANRGANGIDGLISTWLGLAADASDSWLVLGDLSALYDLAGPWVLPQLPAARRFLVVIHNSGGKIFSRVPSLRALPEPARACIENRHDLSFKPVAELWGLSHTLVRDPAELAALAQFGPGCHLVEIRPDAAQTAAFWAASP